MSRCLCVLVLLLLPGTFARADEQQQKEELLRQLMKQLQGGPASYVAPATNEPSPASNVAAPPVPANPYNPPASLSNPQFISPSAVSDGQEMSDKQAMSVVLAAFTDEMRKNRMEKRVDREKMDSIGKTVDGIIVKVDKMEHRVDSLNHAVVGVVENQAKDRQAIIALDSQVQLATAKAESAERRAINAEMGLQQARGQVQSMSGTVADLRQKLKTPILSALFGSW